MKNWQTGRKLIEVYYNHEEGITAIFEKHPAVREAAKKLLKAEVPVMEVLLRD